MAIVEVNTEGLKSPLPIFKLAAKSQEMKKGDILEIIGDNPTFEKDIRAWCERLNKNLLEVTTENDSKKKCRIEF